MRLAKFLLAAERAYWRNQLDSGQTMREIAKASGLGYRQMYYRMRKVGVSAERKGKERGIRGRFLSPEDSRNLSLLSQSERAAVIRMIVNDLRAKHSKEISRMRSARRLQQVTATA